MGHVNAYLMCSPRVGQNANIVEMGKGVYHEHIRARRASARTGNRHALPVDGMARDGFFDAERARTQVTVDERVVRLLGFLLLELCSQ